MTTLMTWGNSDGTQGRCDARCHDAHEPKCDCMCKGRYHGIGSDRAQAQHTRDWFGKENPTGVEVAELAERLKDALGNRGMSVRMPI